MFIDTFIHKQRIKKNMYTPISKQIKIDACEIVREIQDRQGKPFDGRINKYNKYPNLMKLFETINSGITKEDFMYKGPLYRVHVPYTIPYDCINNKVEYCTSDVETDGSCSVLPITYEDKNVVAYSKIGDFNNGKWQKIPKYEKCKFIYANTKNLYGIDVNALYKRFGIDNRFEYENEILFPLYLANIEKEIDCFLEDHSI